MKEIDLPKDILNCIEKLEQSGYESYIVGGAVRNALLGIDANDYDMASSATPEEAMEVFNQYYPTFPTGLKHGTITIQTEHHTIELTTFREEKAYQDFRHPNQVFYTRNVKKDSYRRDFTINALYYHPKCGILDFHHGIYDLQHRILQTIGTPKERFFEDALRILRAIRFQSKYNFKISTATANAMHTMKENLYHLSKERILEELREIIIQPNFNRSFEEFTDIFEYLFEHQFQTDTAESINHCPTNSFAVRFAILLYLSGTPISQFKLKKQELKECEELLKYANEKIQSKVILKKILSQLKYSIKQYIVFKQAIETHENSNKIQEWYQEILSNQECFLKEKLAITIKDLLEMNICSNNIRSLHEACLEQVIMEILPNEKPALIEFVKSSQNLI